MRADLAVYCRPQSTRVGRFLHFGRRAALAPSRAPLDRCRSNLLHDDDVPQKKPSVVLLELDPVALGMTPSNRSHMNMSTAGCAPVWDLIQRTARWGRLEVGQHTGINRQTLTDDDRLVRDWFVTEARSLGCNVKVDEMGNIFAVLAGENSSLPPIGMGSHLDTQPAGGRFDGVLGVIAALQVLRTVKERGVKTFAPLAAIDWTNE
jgi:hypothetical protein